ncbi:AzlD family protein [Rhizobium halophilum]|uniref:AzlD family protein n=1 Tax=Rhizobium halophilum TaxID=2846852 RepID=UPI001EFEA429|nr:AzlD family protein [Rhizobium halophilum]MCF6368252.1 AzlD family protein [Rhizobium halophilum]
MAASLDTGTLLLILAAAVATYITRIGGYILITRMKSIPPRMEAALNAVPAAVLTTLVAPAFFNGAWDVKIAMLVALAVALRFPGLIMLAAGWAAVMICRHLLGL